MKILLLSDDLILGGVARHIIDLANALSSEGVSVTIAATDGPMRSLIDPAVTFVPLSLKNNATLKSRYLGLIPSYRILKKELDLHSYDLIHSHKRFAHLLGWRLAKRFFLPHITSYHTKFTDPFFLSFYGDMTICCAEDIRKRILKDGRTSASNVSVIYNGTYPLPTVPESERRKFRERFSIPPEHCLFGSVGQFVPEKDRPTLLRAFRLLKEKEHTAQCSLLLQGFGPDYQSLLSLRDELQLSDSVHFIPGGEPVQLICSAAEMMVLNSVLEGFPLIILEAASAGKAHIASAISGIPEFIEDGKTGILITPGEPKQLADAMARVVTNEPLRRQLGNAAEKKYKDNFTFNRMLNQYRSLYHSMLKE